MGQRSPVNYNSIFHSYMYTEVISFDSNLASAAV